jgi:hypothetical protein
MSEETWEKLEAKRKELDLSWNMLLLELLKKNAGNN